MKPKTRQNSQPAVSTFIIRVWQELSLEDTRWRGQIEHLQSGQRTGFQDVERMLNILRSFGAFVGEEQQCEPEN